MKLTLENEHGIYSIETKVEYETLTDAYEFAIEPLLKAVGYGETTINEVFGED